MEDFKLSVRLSFAPVKPHSCPGTDSESAHRSTQSHLLLGGGGGHTGRAVAWAPSGRLQKPQIQGSFFAFTWNSPQNVFLSKLHSLVFSCIPQTCLESVTIKG